MRNKISAVSEGLPLKKPYSMNIFIKMEKYTIDELLDVLQWARDRAAYFRACNKRMPGTLYAEDCKAERDAVAELYRRGYYTA